MPADVKRALVFGGTGAIGREVVRGLAQAGVETTFTYLRSDPRELPGRALQIDLSDEAAVRALVHDLAEAPDVFVHCAAVLRGDWRSVQAVNVQAAFAAAEELAPRMAKRRTGDIIFVGALDRTQSLPLPVAFAASQGALAAMAMALAKEHGPSGVRVNVVAAGLLGEGLSRGLDPKLIDDYKAFSALRRLGTAAEVARVVRWLALENTYLSGKVVPANGGL